MFRSTKLIIAGLSLTTLAFAAPMTLADGPTSQPSHQGQGGRMAPGERVQKELDALNLTDDQKKQITPIVEKLKVELQKIKDDKTIEGKDKQAKVKDAVKAAWDDISPILTQDQKDQLKKDMQEHRAANGGGAGGKKADGEKPAPAN